MAVYNEKTMTSPITGTLRKHSCDHNSNHISCKPNTSKESFLNSCFRLYAAAAGAAGGGGAIAGAPVASAPTGAAPAGSSPSCFL